MKRIDLLMKDEQYNEYLRRNQEIESSSNFCPHDIRHHIDVARIAYILILENNDLNFFIRDAELSGKLAAKEVVYAAGLLHDIAKWQEYKTGLDHAAGGSRLAKDLLANALFEPNEIEIISRAIYEHRNLNRDMSFLGERILRADNLSRVCSHCEIWAECPRYARKEKPVFSLEY